MKVCVVGAGAAGLCAAKNAIEFGCNVTVFEQQSKVGGTWLFTEEIGRDKFGLDVHSSMYEGLYTNLPKEIMGFPDFPIPCDREESYISSEEFLNFLNSYVERFNLIEKIKFQHHVVRVRPLADERWEVVVRSLKCETYEIHTFDSILVCNGHYNTPIIPKYEGQDVFVGRQIHAHDYRRASDFAHESVLVVGAGPSGMDLANEISKVARHVTLSHHLQELPKTKFNDNLEQKPDVERLTMTGAEFRDGSSRNYTTILYCTGYKYSFPFLSVDCNVTCDNNFVRPLYKHCININRPTMGFIGLPFYVCAAQMFDLQSRFCLTFITKRKSLPSKSAMMTAHRNEMEERLLKGLREHQAHLMGPEQGKYYAELADIADVEPLKPVITEIHNYSSSRFLDDLNNFRNDKFRIVDDEKFVIV